MRTIASVGAPRSAFTRSTESSVRPLELTLARGVVLRCRDAAPGRSVGIALVFGRICRKRSPSRRTATSSPGRTTRFCSWLRRRGCRRWRSSASRPQPPMRSARGIPAAPEGYRASSLSRPIDRLPGSTMSRTADAAYAWAAANPNQTALATPTAGSSIAKSARRLRSGARLEVAGRLTARQLSGDPRQGSLPTAARSSAPLSLDHHLNAAAASSK